MSKLLSRYVGDRAFYARVLAVAVPIMLQNGITNFVSMLDNIMVGRVGTVEMTGVAVANQLLLVYTLGVFGAAGGAGIFGAQFFGRQDHEGVRHCFRYKLLLCFGITAVVIAVVEWFGTDLCALFLQGEGDVQNAEASLGYATEYLKIMLVGLFPTALVQAYASTLRESGEAMLPMKAGIISVLVNLFFNYVLIFGNLGAPRLGVSGAAIATVISRFVEMGIVVIWTHRHAYRFPFVKGLYRSFRLPGKLAGQMSVKGLPLMINEVLWAVGMTWLNQAYSLKGLDVVAAVNISSTFWNVFSVTFIATGTAIGIIVGQLLGADEFDEARDATRKMMAFAIAISILVGTLYAVCANYIPLLYNTTHEIRQLATGLMQITAIAMPIVAFAHATYFTLRSGGQTFITFLFDSVFVVAIQLPLALVLVNWTDLSILPIFFICQIVEIVKCIFGYILLKRATWLKNIVTDQEE